jgi:TerC family integral membrane protein
MSAATLAATTLASPALDRTVLASGTSGSGGGGLDSIGTPTLWFGALAAVVALLALDFVITRRPHEVSMKEALGWSAFYIALPLAFGGWVYSQYGSETGTEYLTGYLVEKSLSVDNLFVFMLLLTAFAVPEALKQRVLLYGIIGALVLRGIFIALGAAALNRWDFVFLIFGLILVATAVKILRDAIKGSDHDVDVDGLRSVRMLRKFMPVTEDYQGPKIFGKINGKRAVTPFAVVVLAVFATDIVFAVDSVPAVYGITSDPYLVFVTNAFALLGLRALYFVLEGALSALVYLGYGLAAILAFIGAKLVLHWGHMQWDSVPEVPTLASLGVIVAILAVTVVASLIKSKKDKAAQGTDAGAQPSGGDADEKADVSG